MEETKQQSRRPMVIVVPEGGSAPLAQEDATAGQMMYFDGKLWFNAFYPASNKHIWTLATKNNVRKTVLRISGEYKKLLRGRLGRSLNGSDIKAEEVFKEWLLSALPIGSMVLTKAPAEATKADLVMIGIAKSSSTKRQWQEPNEANVRRLRRVVERNGVTSEDVLKQLPFGLSQ